MDSALIHANARVRQSVVRIHWRDLETLADRLDRLVIDDEQSAVPGRQQVIGNWIANGKACHAVALTAHTLVDQPPRRSAADLL